MAPQSIPGGLLATEPEPVFATASVWGTIGVFSAANTSMRGVTRPSRQSVTGFPLPFRSASI